MGDRRWNEAAGWYDSDDCDLVIFAIDTLKRTFRAIDAVEGVEYGERYRAMIFAALARDADPLDEALAVTNGRADDRGPAMLGGRQG